jgi:hypothetical protein
MSAPDFDPRSAGGDTAGDKLFAVPPDLILGLDRSSTSAAGGIDNVAIFVLH